MITMTVSGHLAADATIRTVNGIEVVNFSVASNRRYQNAEGETVNEAVYINCSLWRRSAAAPMLFKGRAVSATGTFATRMYAGADGALRTSLNLRVSSFEVFGKAKQTAAENSPAVQESTTSAELPASEPEIDLPF